MIAHAVSPTVLGFTPTADNRNALRHCYENALYALKENKGKTIVILKAVFFFNF